MPAAARVIPWFVLAFALLALALGLRELSQPPFTDEQLKASLVNTWEVATSTTRVFAIVFLGLGAISVVLARKATEARVRLVAYAAAVACLATLMVYLRNHVVLTQRAAGLTGEELGPLYGLF
jgi:uncharacterized membrane protein YozB (DUF420 family)